MNDKPSISLYSLGCKLNQAESEALSCRLEASGFSITDTDADICIVNTCTVTHIADRKSRHLIKLLRKNNPSACIVTTGCYTEVSPGKLYHAGSDLVITNAEKDNLPRLLQDRYSVGKDLETCPATGRTKATVQTAMSTHQMDSQCLRRTRSFIKIQQGCSNNCTYCIVPSVRGAESSVPVERVIHEVESRVYDGYQEIVLTGTRVGTYAHNGIDLTGLIERILAETDIQRLHISSLQPAEITHRLLSLWDSGRLCPHFHLALQSGSEAVLQHMHRCYSLQEYTNVLSEIRSFIPDAAITTDIMIGFPGESDYEFEESYAFCQAMQFADIHVFPYSLRPGTTAADMNGQISPSIKKKRSLKMLALAKETAENYRKQFLNRIQHVLWEREVTQGTGTYQGLTDHYIRVHTYSSVSIKNQILPVKITGIGKDGLWGDIV